MKKKRVLVIDVGGSHVKLMISRNGKRKKFDSGKDLAPRQMVAATKRELGDWKFDAIAIGFPAPIYRGRIMQDPKNLGKGWIGFNFRKAFGLKKFGEKRWQTEVKRVVTELKKSFIADYVVLGGGNAKCLSRLPRGVALGHNRNAFTGGTRLWQNGARGKPTWNII